MVYDGYGSVTSYYRGDEFLYSVDVNGREVFGPDYIKHIPGLDERKAKAIENMIFGIVLPDHASR